jgi:hypothetical protein
MECWVTDSDPRQLSRRACSNVRVETKIHISDRIRCVLFGARIRRGVTANELEGTSDHTELGGVPSGGLQCERVVAAGQ